MDMFFLTVLWASSFGGTFAALEIANDARSTAWRNALRAAFYAGLTCILFGLLVAVITHGRGIGSGG